MIAEDMIRTVGQHLFSDEGVTVYAVLDGASIPDLMDKLYGLLPEFVCLYRGEMEPDMAEVAPYLVRLDRETEFSDWLIGRGWGRHWGIFAIGKADMRALTRHLQSLLVVYDAAGKPLRFRYYDPRVLRVYLPTCKAEELAAFFGPVACFVVEDEDPSSGLRFWSSSEALQQERWKTGDTYGR